MNITFSSFNVPTLRPFDAVKLQQVFNNVPILRSLESRYFLSGPFLGLIVLVSYLAWLSSASTPVVKGPVAGYRSFLEPTFLLRLRFVFNAVGIMNDGYYKVRDLTVVEPPMLTIDQFKDSSYVVRRMDADVTILASKYLDELRKSGLDELNATHANIHVSHRNSYSMFLFLSQLAECIGKLHQPE
jgi:hypothetical protein